MTHITCRHDHGRHDLNK